jgi:hypothetical protein
MFNLATEDVVIMSVIASLILVLLLALWLASRGR